MYEPPAEVTCRVRVLAALEGLGMLLGVRARAAAQQSG